MFINIFSFDFAAFPTIHRQIIFSCQDKPTSCRRLTSLAKSKLFAYVVSLRWSSRFRKPLSLVESPPAAET